MLCMPVFIFTCGSSALLIRVPTLWFIDLTVATCHYSFYQFFTQENGRLFGVQSINTESLFKKIKNKKINQLINLLQAPLVSLQHMSLHSPVHFQIVHSFSPSSFVGELFLTIPCALLISEKFV